MEGTENDTIGDGSSRCTTRVEKREVVPAAPREIVPIKETLIVLTAPQATSTVPIKGGEAEEMRKDMKEMMELMKNLSINLMNNPSGRGRGRGSYEAAGEGAPNGGRGRGYYGRRLPTCYRCGELGHYSNECNRPPRAGGLFPLPSDLPDRSRDFGVEIKDEARPSRPPVDDKDKGKGKMVSVITVEEPKKEEEEADVMPLGNERPMSERERVLLDPARRRARQKKVMM